jgi:hypothetical protein
MTSDAITNWLEAPATLPDTATLDHALREWPWFVPTRLMEAVRAHKQIPFCEKTMANLRLFTDNWLQAYLLLTYEERAAADIFFDDEDLEDVVDESEFEEEEILSETPANEEPLIQPLYTEDYFRYEGVEAKEAIPPPEPEKPEQPQTLMVMMSFAEWLNHFKTKTRKEQEEARDKSALRSMWQQEKLAAALEDDPGEIPEDVFEMAVSSITKEDDIISEPLAQIYERQEKWSAAAEMYRKLALKYPAKSTYFASRAEAAKKRLL